MARVDGTGGSRGSTLESTIDARGRTTIPKAIREALDLRGGDRVSFVVAGREACIRPLRSVARLRGVVEHAGSTLSLEEMDRAIAKGACES